MLCGRYFMKYLFILITDETHFRFVIVFYTSSNLVKIVYVMCLKCCVFIIYLK